MDDRVNAAIQNWKAITQVSIPMHSEECYLDTNRPRDLRQMMLGNGYGMNYRAFIRQPYGSPRKADELSDTLKICMFTGQWH